MFNPICSALFLDRDGVINYRLPNDYVKNIEQFVLMPGVVEALAALQPLFARIIVVTNQQGVGKGLMTEVNIEAIHAEMLRKLPMIDRVYHCSALATAQHPDRKPNIGMALKAARDFPEIDLGASIMIGDTATDIEFGKRAGMKTLHFGNEPLPVDLKADFHASNWQEVVELLLVR